MVIQERSIIYDNPGVGLHKTEMHGCNCIMRCGTNIELDVVLFCRILHRLQDRSYIEAMQHHLTGGHAMKARSVIYMHCTIYVLCGELTVYTTSIYDHPTNASHSMTMQSWCHTSTSAMSLVIHQWCILHNTSLVCLVCTSLYLPRALSRASLSPLVFLFSSNITILADSSHVSD